MHHSNTYAEYSEAAEVLDNHLGHTDWKEDPESNLYNAALINKTTRRLYQFRDNLGASKTLKKTLLSAVKANHGGCANISLYSHSYLGTKYSIEDYYDELELSLEHVFKTTELSLDEKKTFFKHASRNYG